MRRATVAAAFVVAAVAAPGLAAPAICTVVTDAVGDVEVAGVPQTGGRLDDAHVDIESAGVTVRARTLYVRFAAADLSDSRKGEWRLTFVTRGHRAFVMAGSGMWLNVGDAGAARGFFAGLSGRDASEVRGTIDYGRDVIEVQVPLTAFGGAAPRKGDVLTGFAVEAVEHVVHAGPAGVGGADVSLRDTAASSARHAVGRC